EKTKEKPIIYSDFVSNPSWGAVNNSHYFSSYWGKENIIKQADGSIKVLYPKGSYKPSAKPRGGAGFIYNMQEGYEELTFSYDITFAENFNFVKGGKLPGLCGGDCPRGGTNSDNGFSVRFAWKTDGFLDTYSVFPGSSKYGDFGNKNAFQFESGNTYTIKQKIKLNTPGEQNGLLEVYVNDKQVSQNSYMLYRNSQDITINSLFFNTFFGGSDASWATPDDTEIIFNNLKIEQ
ncbi:MAG: hypothetical protein GY828_04620, partial [Candidatus Gracilibacteria bacterium]|nr:hypothetical protein [Candidatus Gracilibacteria bacterium]